MRNYVYATRITAVIAFISFIVSLFFHYGCEADFWCNVSLAIFGSSLLTCITSIIGYVTERRRTFESFLYSSRSLLHIINKYSADWALLQKIDFFLDYADFDKSMWDSQFGDFYFMCDLDEKKRSYIYHKIYKPILDFSQRVSEHSFHFKCYKEGTGKNDTVMQKFVAEIEESFMENKSIDQLSDDGKIYQINTIQNKLVHDTLEELNGRYFDIMYGKSTSK